MKKEVDEIDTLLIMKHMEAEMSKLLNYQRRLLDSLKIAPEGSLFARYYKGKYKQYYHRTRDRRNGKYLGSDDEVLIRALAQKRYDSTALIKVETQIDQVKAILENASNEAVSSIIQEIPEWCRPLIVPLELSDEDYIKKWKKDNPGYQNDYPFYGEYYTSGLERVRSKTEALLAEMFSARKIPYVYEPKLVLPDGTVFIPDFILLNVRTRMTYVEEHFGMMSNPEYAEKAINKISLYEKNGYYPGINLLLTFETERQPLNILTAENYFCRYLV